ncbi:MAG: hypothetical protein IT342_05345 [Candidatus Melainabacteria bacterium]|nr:hypothetical protein [Candidatus Melainabacteria bacterium]
MSVLDTNFDSPSEMPTRAAWLDNASASLLNDNSYFNAASKNSDVSAWLGKVDFFDSGRVPAAFKDAPAGDSVPVPVEPNPAVPPEPPHAPGEKPAVEIELVPAGAAPGIGPRAVEGPPPPGVAPVGLPGNGPPEHTGDTTPVAQSRRNSGHNQVSTSETGVTPVEPGPGPDGRNADGTYGAGHHPYTPPTYYPDNAGTDMNEYKRPALAVEETPAPVYTPRVPNAAALQALVAAMKRYKESGHSTGQTGTEGEGPKVAHADPNYVPPAGSFGGLRGGRGG